MTEELIFNYSNQLASSVTLFFLEEYINTALLEKELAGLLIWILVDFNQPKANFSHAHKNGPAADDLMANFGLLDQSLNPKPSYSLVQKLFLNM